MLKRKSLLQVFLAVSLIYTVGLNFKTKAMENYEKNVKENTNTINEETIEIKGKTYEIGQYIKADMEKVKYLLTSNFSEDDNYDIIVQGSLDNYRNKASLYEDTLDFIVHNNDESKLYDVITTKNNKIQFNLDNFDKKDFETDIANKFNDLIFLARNKKFKNLKYNVEYDDQNNIKESYKYKDIKNTKKNILEKNDKYKTILNIISNLKNAESSTYVKHNKDEIPQKVNSYFGKDYFEFKYDIIKILKNSFKEHIKPLIDIGELINNNEHRTILLPQYIKNIINKYKVICSDRMTEIQDMFKKDKIPANLREDATKFLRNALEKLINIDKFYDCFEEFVNNIENDKDYIKSILENTK